MQNKQISYQDFCTHFKLIRHERDYHLGEHSLMKDTKNKRRVIVKRHEYQDAAELEEIITDIQRLIKMYDKSINLCNLVGFCLQETRTANCINFIYDYHQVTLEEEIKSMGLHKQKFSDKDIDTFLNCMIKALACLEQCGFHHLSINSNFVLMENKDAIDLNFSLLFTPFVSNAIEYIQNCSINVEDFNLSELQLTQLSLKSHSQPTFSQKLKIDKQSVGLMALRLAHLNQDRIYEMNENFQVTWNSDHFKFLLDSLKSNYSKQINEKVLFLIFQNSFYSFKDIPSFGTPSRYSSNSKTGKKMNLSFSSGKNILKYSPSNTNEKSFHQSCVSQIKQISYFSSNFKIKADELENSLQDLKDSRERKFSPQKQKLQKYEDIKNKIQNSIFDKIQNIQKQQVETSEYTYIGMLKGNARDGIGICYFKNGDIYGGDWKENQMQGEGNMLFVNGDHYFGTILTGIRNGEGKYFYKSGNVYEGTWKQNKKEGFGIFTNTRKQKYEGQWVNGKKHGKGTYAWGYGDRFEGNFEYDQKNGPGCLTKSNGNKISGNWKNNKINGIAKITFHSGGSYVGEINEKQEMHGQGSQTTRQGTICQGSYRNGCREGKCKINYLNGDFFEGYLKQNLFQGLGRYYYSYFEYSYIGEWKKGVQQGKGRVQFKNGSKIECNWKAGKNQRYGEIIYWNGDCYNGEINGMGCNGRGKYIKRDGTIKEGFFKNGVWMGK